ncbi:MAG: DUF373 family protein, partial [Candidatus Aenigmatarchaeota archaeon]
MKEGILVVCVDRDNDLGEKAGAEGPILGREANLEAAKRLAVADPSDSDANCLFGAIREYDELKAAGRKVSIATLTGDSRGGTTSDEKIQEQLDVAIEEYHPKKAVFVSDGAEDELIIPVVQSKLPIVSVRRIVVKQSTNLESGYYMV